MKDYLLELAEKNTANKLNVVREYLQEYILRILQEQGFFNNVAFVGDTALRFIYNVPRFSEDLDFSAFESKFSWQKILLSLKKELELAGYKINIKSKENIILSAMLKFSDIAYETGIAAQKEQLLNIKLEVDTNPPVGGKREVLSINKHLFLSLNHYDLASLFAGKINALLTRSYTKGRDIFDIFWIISRYPELTPNLELLENSLKQYNFSDNSDWRDLVVNKISALSWPEVIKDVENFVEDRFMLQSMQQAQLLKLLEK